MCASMNMKTMIHYIGVLGRLQVVGFTMVLYYSYQKHRTKYKRIVASWKYMGSL